MGTSVGVGQSSKREDFQAGREAAQRAFEQMGREKADLVLVFATVGYDQRKLMEGIKDVTGNTPLSGCSGEGIITQHGSDEGSHAVAVMAVHSQEMTFRTFQIGRLSQRSRECGLELAAQLSRISSIEDKLLLLFPDGLKVNCTQLLSALETNLRFPLKIVGGTAGDVGRLMGTYQYYDGLVNSDAVSAVLVRGEVSLEIVAGHGCEPVGVERIITRAQGNRVEEIDGIPAWAVFKEYLDGDPESLHAEDVVHLCIGEKLPENESYTYNRYIIRTPLGLDNKTGSLFFPTEISPGTKIQMTRRDPQKIAENARLLAQQIKSRHPDQKPVAVLQFDCAGRGRVLFGERINELTIHPVQNILGKTIPWIGFHTFGEIAPLTGATYFHNYTIVLCALYAIA